jgi:site-specific recombinase XerD
MKLSSLVAEYVSFNQGIGMGYRSEAEVLSSFCKAMGNIEIEAINSAQVEAFLTGTGPITAFWHRKYGILNGLYRFAICRGYITSSPLPKTIPKRPEKLIPHIYTIDELRQLLAATDSLESRTSPLRVSTFRTILLTLYGTGLRISEALSLTIADVNLSDNLLIVRNSKFYKTRLVPIGPRLIEQLRLYLKKRCQLPRLFGEDSAFFANRTGKALSYIYMYEVFCVLRNLAGIHRRDDAHYSPRIHDIRHTFAVHRLEAWYREGADVQRLLPILSTYLGHLDLIDSQCYLTMTQNLLQEANQRFERYALSEVKYV